MNAKAHKMGVVFAQHALTEALAAGEIGAEQHRAATLEVEVAGMSGGHGGRATARTRRGPGGSTARERAGPFPTTHPSHGSRRSRGGRPWGLTRT